MDTTPDKVPPPDPPKDASEVEAEPGLPQRLFDEARAHFPELEPNVECLAAVVSRVVAVTYEEARAHTVGRMQEHLLQLFETLSEAPDSKSIKLMRGDPIAAHKAVVVGVRAAVLATLAQTAELDAIDDDDLEDGVVGPTKGSA